MKQKYIYFLLSSKAGGIWGKKKNIFLRGPDPRAEETNEPFVVVISQCSQISTFTNPVLPKLIEMKKKPCTKPKLSLRVELCLKGGRSVWNQTELNTLVCIAGLTKVASEVCATHPNILQLSREGECVHECEEKQILWPVGPPHYSMFLSTVRSITWLCR